MNDYNNHLLLVLTSHMFLTPVGFYISTQKQTHLQNLLAILLTTNYAFSSLFWWYPIKHNIIHKCDIMLAKLSFVSFIVYTLGSPKVSNESKILFLLILRQTLNTFNHSHRISSKDWCSIEHIKCHAIFHCLVSMGCFIALSHTPLVNWDIDVGHFR